MTCICSPLPAEEVSAAIERRNPSRIPLVMCKWWGEGLKGQYGDKLIQLDRTFPDDASLYMIDPLGTKKMNLWWLNDDGVAKGKDSGGLLPDWKYLDDFISQIQSPRESGLFDPLNAWSGDNRNKNRYGLFGFWNLFFERPWTLRGMENLMMDYYDHPGEIHALHSALCDQYVALIQRAAEELKPNGFWTSDDLGNQRQLMMRPQTFREFLKPYYVRIGNACREAGMHFWLHSCGNNTEILEDLIESGVDVFHPVQKHTMDERAVAREFGQRITFLVGFDVQHMLREGTTQQVRAEVRHLIDTFDRPDGGMGLAAGNGIVAGTPLENIEAFLHEAVTYGQAHRRSYKK